MGKVWEGHLRVAGVEEEKMAICGQRQHSHSLGDCSGRTEQRHEREKKGEPAENDGVVHQTLNLGD